ncbi:hypothetical protein Fmac_004017 [Flemingia macrophylla]|uniref:RING-type domain-containing protein n=1 Tax=Flemingia macrophylla TaxID=520843 RepID=A0ABD1N3Q4_9FABA
MGFPVGYSEVFCPKLLLYILSLMGFLRTLICGLFGFMGLEPDHIDHYVLLPVVRFRELAEPPETCAVCLSEFEENDEIRRLPNCQHIFHRGCLDRWMDYYHRTCPLCRRWCSHNYAHTHTLPTLSDS